MKTFFLTIVILILFTSCSNNNDATPPFTPSPITPILIGQGFAFGSNYTPANLVIYNQSDWNAFLVSMNSVSNTFTNTTLDFNLYQVIAIIDSYRGGTYYSVNIDTIIENENNITIDFSLLFSTSGFTLMGHPYHIVKIPKSAKPVIFQ